MEILHDLKMQFVDLLLVMWIFWGQIGHKNYEDFEHPTLQGDRFYKPFYARALPWAMEGIGLSARFVRLNFTLGIHRLSNSHPYVHLRV